MDEHKAMPVHGYTDQSQLKVDIVNEHKEMEERVLRRLDYLRDAGGWDQRWLAIARTHIEEGFMAMNRAIFQPGRIKLPGD